MAKGKTIGCYALEEEIGAGGMGEVWLATHPVLLRPTVLKRLHRELAAVPEILERFEREARACAAVHHGNVVLVYDAFSWRGELYIAQEYIDGADLRTVLERTGRLPPRIAALIALEVARGLEAIHARGTVHRDLKPANVLLGRGGEVKIADFGIALESGSPALTRAGVVLGTPDYMAPEQLEGQRVDIRADLFALGALLYEMLTGAPPYVETQADRESEACSRLSRMRRERYMPLRKLRRDVPRSLARLVRWCLRSHASQRPQSTSELRTRLERCALRHFQQASSASLRAELAGWLWDRGVFRQRENETVVCLAAQSRQRRSRAWRVAACLLVTLATTAGALAITSVVRPAWVSRAAPSLAAWLPSRAVKATLSLRAPPGTTVRIDGDSPRPIDGALAVELPAGRHALVFAHPAHKPRTVDVELAPGEHADLDAPFSR
jgi:hypothetical protein